MAMRVSDRGIAEIASHEGIVPYPYYDSAGVLTFGIGHTRSAGPPNPATMPKGVERPMVEVIDLFRRDLAKYEKRVNAAVKVPLQQHEFDALVSFDYNTGGIHAASLTRHLNAGNRAAAAKAFMNWSKPAEIIPRRRAEQRLFRTGQYGDGMATIFPADANGRVQWSKGRRVNVLALMKRSPANIDNIGVEVDGFVPPQPPLAAAIYTVRRGDTLSGIGARLGIPWPAIADENDIGPPWVIQPGQVLRIPAQKPAEPLPPVPAPSPVPEPPRPPVVKPEPVRGGFWAWLWRWFG